MTTPAPRPGRLAPRFLGLAALGLAACVGGGGSSSSPALTLAFTPGQLTAHYFHNQQSGVNTYAGPPSATVNGTISPVPSGNLYVVIVEDAPVFVGDPVLTSLGGNAFSLALAPDVALAAGVHSGNLTIRMFQDAALSKPYAVNGGTLPYALTVDPELTVTVTIDGAPVAPVFSSSNTAVTTINTIGYTIYWQPGQPAASFTLAPGQVIGLQASVPVTWYSPDLYYPYGYLWPAPTLTSTALTQAMAPPPQGSTGMTGNAYVAMPVTPGQWGAGLVVDIQQ